MWDEIGQRIGTARGVPFHARRARGAGGGCINQAYILEGDDGSACFVKLNDPGMLEMFAAEAEGLADIRATATIGAPEPLCRGVTATHAYLVLECLELTSRGDAEVSGRQLAAMHRHTGPHYGWRRDNTIGSTPQINTPASDWIGFWRVRRLGYQLQLAAGNGHGGTLQRRGERLLSDMDVFFAGYRPAPSLLHGDLWSGNHAYDAGGRPVVYDPAVYYGDRETDLAMTELFGGFPPSFYSAYREAWPLDPGYRIRRTLYNLYHVLNHLNLFGGGYRAQAEGMIGELLAETR